MLISRMQIHALSGIAIDTRFYLLKTSDLLLECNIDDVIIDGESENRFYTSDN